MIYIHGIFYSFLKIIPISSGVYCSWPGASNDILLTGNWYNLQKAIEYIKYKIYPFVKPMIR